MSRLQAELSRLYRTDPAAPPGVRALRMDVAAQAGWEAVAELGRGVQADLDLPAPGIAVDGRAGWQLWFSLAEPVAPDQAEAFLDGLRRRYLGSVPAHRITLHPGVAGSEALPPAPVGPDRWAAFLSPDLAPLFADEPWLDHPPGEDAQADLLSRLAPVPPATFGRVLQQLAPEAQGGGTPDRATDPRAFLLSVMQDPAVDLRLRIEAAKALLPHAG